MRTFSRIKVDIKSPAARVTLARREVRNAFDDVLIGELTRALEEIRVLYEAARLDGASPAQMFWRVTLPQLRYTIVTSSTLIIVGSLTYLTSSTS